MADNRPKRQRAVRSSTEFFGASLLHKEEVELRRALNASLKEARSAQQKKREKPELEPMIETRSICTNTNARFRIKASCDSKSEKTSKRNSKKKKSEAEERESERKPWDGSQILTKSSISKEVGKCLQRKELQSPAAKSHKVAKPFKRKLELKILPQGKTARKLLKSKQMKSAKKSRVVQSLTEKFSSAEKVTGCAKRKKESESLVETCSNQVKKKKKMSTLQKGEVAKAEQIVCSFEEINTSDSIHELRQQVSTALQGKLKRRNKHKLKDRKLVNPLGEIYIPANIAKTEDFLTFLCLRGNSSLPRSFEVFNNPDPFFTQPAHQFPDEGAMFPIQSSVTYSPPLSSAPSESSAASPMSSTDGWLVNDD